MTAVGRMTTPEIVATLVDGLGPTMVALVANVRDRRLPHRWRSGTITPRVVDELHLRSAMVAWQTIEVSDGPNVARAWFVGSNPRLGDTSPCMALRDGRFADVAAAARAFVDGVDA